MFKLSQKYIDFIKDMDSKAAAYVRDTAGQMPTSNIEVKTEVSSKLADIMEQLKGE